MIITANEVKKNGVSMFDGLLKQSDELVINVRGKNKYVILDIQRYKDFRENELDLAHMRAMEDIEVGNYTNQTAKEHIKELMDEL